MIAYHWSPSTRRRSIARSGLIVGARPHVNGEHRNAHISLARTPADAWALSGQHLARRGVRAESSGWDLWQVDLTGLPYRTLHTGSRELVTRCPIPTGRVQLVATRQSDLRKHD